MNVYILHSSCTEWSRVLKICCIGDPRDVGWQTGRLPHHLRSAVLLVSVRITYVHSTNNVCISSSGSIAPATSALE